MCGPNNSSVRKPLVHRHYFSLLTLVGKKVKVHAPRKRPLPLVGEVALWYRLTLPCQQSHGDVPVGTRCILSPPPSLFPSFYFSHHFSCIGSVDYFRFNFLFGCRSVYYTPAYLLPPFSLASSDVFVGQNPFVKGCARSGSKVPGSKSRCLASFIVFVHSEEKVQRYLSVNSESRKPFYSKIGHSNNSYIYINIAKSVSCGADSTPRASNNFQAPFQQNLPRHRQR